MKLPHRKSTILSVLSFVAGLGGAGLFGYVVVPVQYIHNADFDYVAQTVESVTDGDTFRTTSGEVVRMYGIDAPEIGQCYHTESTQALTELINGRTVWTTKELTATDDFGRLTRWVRLDTADPRTDNILVNHYMVYHGYAIDTSSTVDKAYRNYLVKARESARAQGRGLWSACPDLVAAANTTINSPDDPPTDPACLIKGNISNQGSGRTYFLPGCGNYGRVKIDRSKGEAYFCAESDAIEAGFTKSASCLNNGL